jgi:hypothetical protein
MGNELTPEHRTLVGQVHERVGRNVLRVQALEGKLKLLLSLVDPVGKSHAHEDAGDRSAQIAKQTLGNLASSFLESISSDDLRFGESIKKIVKDRNDLVHHFYSTVGSLMSTDNGCGRATQQLDAQLEEIKAFEVVVNEFLMAILHAIKEISFQGTPEYDRLSAVHASLRSALGTADYEKLPPDFLPITSLP